MSFEVEFDDFKRKVVKKSEEINHPIYLNKVAFTTTNSPEYEAWLKIFSDPANTTLEAFHTRDGKYCTFYTVFTDPHTVELAKAGERARLLEIEADRRRDGVSA